MNVNDAMSEASRWGRAIKFVSISWFAFFFNLWLDGKIASGLLFVATLMAVYWTVGSSLEESACVANFVSTSCPKS